VWCNVGLRGLRVGGVGVGEGCFGVWRSWRLEGLLSVSDLNPDCDFHNRNAHTMHTDSAAWVKSSRMSK